VDPYSFTQDVLWINHEWLHEILSAGAYQMVGVSGLIMVKALLVAGTLAVVGDALAEAALPVQWAAVAFAALAMLPLSLTIRPQVWTLLFLVVECRILSARRGFWALPFIFAAWANLHGAWVVGAGVLIVWSTATVVWEPRTLRRSVVLAVLASAAATLLTPYGTALWRFLPTAAQGSRDVIEWLPIWTASPLLWAEWLLGVAFIGVCLRHREAVSRPAIAVACALAAGGLWVTRILPLALVANIVIAGPALAVWVPLPARDRDLCRWGNVAAVVTLLAAVVLAVRPTTRCLEIAGNWAPDLAAADTLRTNGASGRLVLPFRWGDYAIWRLAPKLKVSIDGRREVHSERATMEGFGIEAGSAEGLAALAAWRADYVWLGAESTRTKEWLSDHGYRIDVDGPRSYIAVLQEHPPLRPSAGGDNRCFPE
jgi:hypothetical protein